MPPRKPVKPLYELCIQVIIRNIDVYPMIEIRSLPTTLLEELIKFTHDRYETIFVENKARNTSVLKLNIDYKIQMITENITELDLRFWNLNQRVDIEYVLRSITKLFKHMKRFSCAGDLMHQEILNLVHCIPNVIDLHLSCSNVNDDIIEVIGDICPNLERLSLAFCRITDDGIRRLCNSKSRGSNITHLTISGSYSYGIKGCLMALYNLKRLRVFSGYNVINAFKKLFQDLNGSHEWPTFQLCELPYIYMGEIPTGFLNFLIKCCPNVPNLCIHFSDNISNDVTELKSCDKIVPFEIIRCDEISHLIDVGSNVTSLNFHSCNVDLELIGYNFANLKELLLFNVTYQPIVNLKRKTYVIPFRKLQKLQIHDTIDEPHLKFLLQNCVDLGKLLLDLITADENVFSVICKINPLRHLTCLELYGRTRACKLLILQLLKMENNLQSVRAGFRSLDDESFLDYKYEIESYAQENNLGISIGFIRYLV